MATLETVTVKGEELTIDLILWRRFKRPTPGLFERVLALNPGVADSGPLLAIGTTFVIPIDAPASTTEIVPAVRLWD